MEKYFWDDLGFGSIGVYLVSVIGEGKSVSV